MVMVNKHGSLGQIFGARYLETHMLKEFIQTMYLILLISK